MSKGHTDELSCTVGHLILMLALWYLSTYCNHKLHKALHILLRSKECLPPLPPLLLIWEQQYNPLFVFASSLLWIGCNVFLLISCLKYSEVLLLSESAVNLFSTGFHPHRLFSLFIRLTQQAHLSVFWGLSVGAGGMSHQAAHPHLLPSLPSIAWLARDFKSLYSPKSLTQRKSFQRAAAASIIRLKPSLSLPTPSMHHSSTVVCAATLIIGLPLCFVLWHKCFGCGWQYRESWGRLREKRPVTLLHTESGRGDWWDKIAHLVAPKQRADWHFVSVQRLDKWSMSIFGAARAHTESHATTWRDSTF